MANDYATSTFRVNSLISISLPTLKGVRDAKGRFTSAQSKMRSRNHDFAVALQADVVELTEQRITRRAASTDRLVKVTGSPHNVQYDTWRAGVGVVSFLDSSIAKYWRTFEEGSAAVWEHPFIGTQLKPYGRNVPFPVAHGAKPGLRTFTGGKLMSWMDGEKWVVKKEIAPRHPYRDAVARANPEVFAYENARQLLREIWER